MAVTSSAAHRLQAPKAPAGVPMDRQAVLPSCLISLCLLWGIGGIAVSGPYYMIVEYANV